MSVEHFGIFLKNEWTDKKSTHQRNNLTMWGKQWVKWAEINPDTVQQYRTVQSYFGGRLYHLFYRNLEDYKLPWPNVLLTTLISRITYLISKYPLNINNNNFYNNNHEENKKNALRSCENCTKVILESVFSFFCFFFTKILRNTKEMRIFIPCKSNHKTCWA